MARLRFLFIGFCILLVQCNLKSVIILVPGSFSIASNWHSINGAFFKSLEKTARIFNQSTITFNWSGIPTYNEIKKAGQMLAKLINSYPKDEVFILVAHSHGGNVVNIASQILNNIEEEILEQASHISNEDLKKALSNKGSAATQPVKILANKQNHEFDFIVTTREPKTALKPHIYKIDSVYLLGTPADTQLYAPQMNVIKNLFNFYSDGDYVQSVAGIYNKKYPKHERITNIQIKIRDSKTNKDYAPSHSEIHNLIIGGWLLLIPFKLKDAKISGFKEFETGKNYTVVFRETNFPIITLNTKLQDIPSLAHPAQKLDN